jgi:hypothetical protein
MSAESKDSGGSMTDETHCIYRDPARTTGILKTIIIVLLLTYAVEIVLVFLQYKLLTDFQAGHFASMDDAVAVARANDARLKAMSLFLTLIILGTTIAFLCWVYRASTNVHALGARGLTASAAFAVGMYFIPFYNLFAPAVTMNEIRKASFDAPDWNAQKMSPIIAVWWILQIATGVGGIATFAASNANGHSVEGLKATSLFLLVSFAVNIAFHTSQFILANGIANAQRVQRARSGVT